MHIVDGALPNSIVIAGGVAAVAGLAVGLRKLKTEDIPVAGVLSATFFIASLAHVPLGFSSVHLIMNGLAGLLLGWAAFPTLFVGLLLQALFFGFGGLTVLGINTLNIAGPAVLVGLLCRPFIINASARTAILWGGIAGGLSIALTTAFVALSLTLAGDSFFLAAKVAFIAHIPVMVIEALACAAAVALIRKTKPELLQAPLLAKGTSS